MGLIKILLSVSLGLVIFLGILAYLSSESIQPHLLSADFYTKNLSDNDAYNRLYETVLVPSIEDQLDLEERAGFIGGLKVNNDDVNDLVKGILPPPELRSQVEAAIVEALDYLNKDQTDGVITEPEIYIYFRPILGTRVPTAEGVDALEGTAKPVLFRFLVRQIENNVEVLPEAEGTLTQKIELLSQQLYETLSQLQDPKFPLTIPSLSGVPSNVKQSIYEEAKIALLAEGVDPVISAGLANSDLEIKKALLANDPEQATIGALSIAIVSIADPLMNKAFNSFRDNHLDSEDRLDLLGTIAKDRGDTKKEILKDVDRIRVWLKRTEAFGSGIAILIIALASIVVGLVNLPNIRSSLRWPGLSLFLSAGTFLAMSLILRTELPDRLENLLTEGNHGCDALGTESLTFSTALCEIGLDVGRSMITTISGSLITNTAIIMAIGGALVIFSLLLSKKPIGTA